MTQSCEYITIPIWAIKIVTRKGYMERYYYHKSFGLTNRAAWEKLEDELFEYFEQNRYTSLDSFQNSMRQWQQIQKKINNP